MMTSPKRWERSAIALGRVRSDGRRSAENASDASRGRSVGRWSIEQTVRGGPAAILQVRGRNGSNRDGGVVSARSGTEGPRPTERWSLPRDVNGRVVEGRVDGVDRDWVVGVRGIATDVDDDAEGSLVAVSRDRLGRDERRDLGGQVDAVDENVDWRVETGSASCVAMEGAYRRTIKDLLERSSLGRLGHVPLDDVLAARPKLASARAPRHSAQVPQDSKGAHLLNPAFKKKSTAPLPHLPSAPMTNALGLLPKLFSTCASSPLT